MLNTVSTVLEAAPSNVKSVVPTVVILYSVPCVAVVTSISPPKSLAGGFCIIV
jgi:hypothetical protein